MDPQFFRQVLTIDHAIRGEDATSVAGTKSMHFLPSRDFYSMVDKERLAGREKHFRPGIMNETS
jgi:hypothetical protein